MARWDFIQVATCESVKYVYVHFACASACEYYRVRTCVHLITLAWLVDWILDGKMGERMEGVNGP